jgi:hypothetical protein
MGRIFEMIVLKARNKKTLFSDHASMNMDFTALTDCNHPNMSEYRHKYHNTTVSQDIFASLAHLKRPGDER